jgi:hypothetical protein
MRGELKCGRGGCGNSQSLAGLDKHVMRALHWEGGSFLSVDMKSPKSRPDLKLVRHASPNLLEVKAGRAVPGFTLSFALSAPLRQKHPIIPLILPPSLAPSLATGAAAQVIREIRHPRGR